MSRRFEETRPENNIEYSSSQINACRHCEDYGEFDEDWVTPKANINAYYKNEVQRWGDSC